MRILVTGLCMQGNKGGPAIALSLKDAIVRYRPDVDLVFSVPGGEEFQYEVEAAAQFRTTVIEKVSLKNLFPPYLFLGGNFRRAKVWLRNLRSSAALMDMTAVSYVGPPTGRVKSILNGRFTYWSIARILGVKFLPWTQSYGPFSTRLVRTLARIDLGSVPVVFCRGEECKKRVLELLPHAKAESYPDVAVTLGADDGDLDSFGSWASQDYVTVSPSAVLYSKSGGVGIDNNHVRALAEACRSQMDAGLNIVLLPHTVRKINSVPNSCDAAVCRLIHSSIAQSDKLFLVENDYGPKELKRIISGAKIHVGGRYHSVVAALSTGVPCISISWHQKYRDLMAQYDMAKYVIESMESGGPSELIAKIEDIMENRSSLAKKICDCQSNVEQMVRVNVERYLSLLAER